MINVGDTLHLEPLHSEKKDRYRCKIMEVFEYQLAIDYPSNELTNRTEFFFDGTEFKASFVGKDKAAYHFTTELQGRKIEQIPLLMISYPDLEQLEKIQRREFVRVESMIDVAVHLEEGGLSPFKTVALDISAGGMLLSLPKKHQLKKGMTIDCLVVLPMQSGEKTYLDLKCQVLRILPGRNADKERASIQFEKLRNTDRQPIMRYCFEQQLILKKKGILVPE